MARVTVAIPFFNNGSTLAAAVQSVFCQTYRDWQLILLDDGSVDESLAVARSICDTRVRVLTDGRNRGLVYRLNQVVSLAQDEFFSRMDADDLMHPEKLARQIEYLQAHPEVDLVGTYMYRIDRANVPIGSVTPSSWNGFLRPCNATVTGRTAWFKSNPYDPLYLRAEDLELWVRTQGSAVIANLPLPLYFYRRSGCYGYRKHWQVHASERRILRRYGPIYRGRKWALIQLIVNWGRVVAHALIHLTGFEKMWAKRQVSRFTAEERVAAARTIAQILKTPVRGLYPQRIETKPVKTLSSAGA